MISFKKTKKPLKTLLAAVLIITVFFAFTACGGSKYADVKIDAAKMANGLISEIDFESNLQQVGNDNITTFIPMEGYESGYMFMGEGSHADSFGVFVFSDEKAAKDGEKAVNEYLKELEDSFSKYIPEEADKVKEHSLVIREGRNLVFTVSPDEEACEEVIMRIFEEEAADPSKIVSDDGEEGEEGEENASEEVTEASDGSVISENNYPVIDTDSKLTYSGYVGLVGDSAYELYTYVDGVAENYADAVNYTADQLDGKSKVYDLIVPLASGVTLPDKYFSKIQSSDQMKSLNNLYEKLNDKVTPVNIYDNMMKHRNEYIYYRTDHHWTSLGAYYGYETWCNTKGILPISLERRQKVNYGDFVGSLYYDTKESILKKNPDSFDVYMPLNDVYISAKDSNGNSVKKDVISDFSEAPDYAKYDCFIGGDKALVTIVNNDAIDDSTCMVIKESFGNSIVPYLADHYSKVYVYDYRYTSKNLVEEAKEKGVDDVIFINNIGMTRSSYLVGKLSTAVKGK